MSIADDMTSGIACEMCGEDLDCEFCEDTGIAMYCSEACAEDRGMSIIQVCKHKKHA